MTNEELRELCEAIGESEWEYTIDDDGGEGIGDILYACLYWDNGLKVAAATTGYEHFARFICAARTAVPRLLDDIKQLQGECATLQARMEELGVEKELEEKRR